MTGCISQKDTILTVDVGNTSIVFGLFTEGILAFTERISTQKEADAFFYSKQIQTIIHKRNLEKHIIRGAIVSSVVPQINDALSLALSFFVQGEVIVASRNMLGLPRIKKYDEKSVGMDRLMDCLGAYKICNSAAIVFDFGTCSVMSVIDKDGFFVGGTIAPGIQTSLTALYEKTSALPKLDAVMLDVNTNVIAKDTKNSMLNGVIIGAAAMLDVLAAKAKNELFISYDENECINTAFNNGNEHRNLLSDNVEVVVTGGLGRLVIPFCKTKVRYVENLQLEALYYLYYINMQEKMIANC